MEWIDPTREVGGQTEARYRPSELAGAMEQPGDGTAMFSDCIALAFFAHVVRAYGRMSAGGRNIRGCLAPWQLRRACDFIIANLGGDPSMAEVANECRLSSSYFARAFKETTGVPPFRWVTNQRIVRPEILVFQCPNCHCVRAVQPTGVIRRRVRREVADELLGLKA